MLLDPYICNSCIYRKQKNANAIQLGTQFTQYKNSGPLQYLELENKLISFRSLQTYSDINFIELVPKYTKNYVETASYYIHD